MDSPNLLRLRELGYDETNSSVTQKREIECYIHPDYFKTLNPPIEIEYGDWDDVKTICKNQFLIGIRNIHNYSQCAS